MLHGRKILIGITGSIAAYKSVYLVRNLVKQGAQVKVILTESANDFVTKLTLSTLSKNPVYSSYFEEQTGEWNNHVALGLWADLFIIAPATANTLAKMNAGTADNLLLATYLSARCPVWVAPAMDLDMWNHETTQRNIAALDKINVNIIAPEEGELASGLAGQGRMAEPEHIEQQVMEHFQIKGPLFEKKVLITAGPTYEAIDPVRYISNHSTGKMGYALAESARDMGARVTIVAGPTNLPDPEGVEVIHVTSAQEMFHEVNDRFRKADIAIMAAAVADYRPKDAADEKIKKHADEMEISLVKNPDILLEMGKIKQDNQLLVGFALETRNEKANAQRKLEQKNLDFIVLNSLNDDGAGFAVDTNKVTILDKHNNAVEYKLKSKMEISADILKHILR